MNSSPKLNINKDKAWKWLGWAVAAILAAQLYFVREMLAAEVLFAIAFVALVVGFAVFYVLSSFGIHVLSIAESAVAVAAPFVRRAYGHIEYFSGRPSRRLRSASAR
jgi:hypothetical protein